MDRLYSWNELAARLTRAAKQAFRVEGPGELVLVFDDEGNYVSWRMHPKLSGTRSQVEGLVIPLDLQPLSDTPLRGPPAAA